MPDAGSLDVPAFVGDRGRGAPPSLGELDPDSAPGTDPEATALIAAEHASVREALDKLRKDDCVLLERRYGLGNAGADTLEELGDRFGVPHEAVGWWAPRAEETLDRCRDLPRASRPSPSYFSPTAAGITPDIKITEMYRIYENGNQERWRRWFVVAGWIDHSNGALLARVRDRLVGPLDPSRIAARFRL